MNKHKKRIDELIRVYNKIADKTKQFYEPSLYDYLSLFLEKHSEGLKDVKENDIVAALFTLLYDYHLDEVEDGDLYENILRTLRVWSRKDDIFYLSLYMHDQLGFDVFEEDSEDDDLCQYFEGAIKELLIDHHIEILEKLPENPFIKIRQLQEQKAVDMDLKDLVDDIVFRLHNTHSFNEILVYNLLYLSPFAHTTMSLFLAVNDDENRIELLKCMINAFERTHQDVIKNPPKNFYETDDFREYILSLDSLGYLQKMQGDFDAAILNYEKALKYDDLDKLNIKASLLFPYIMSSRLDKASDLLERLPERSIHRRYMRLYLDFHAGMEIDQAFQSSYDISSKIMDGLIIRDIVFESLSTEERSFVTDFFELLTRDELFINRLKSLNDERIVS